MSCLFIALGYFVKEDPTVLRQRICDFLESNAMLMTDVDSENVVMWTENVNLKDYVASMRSTSTWGGAIEIKAFCELYKRSVRVFNGQRKLLATFAEGDSIDLIWTGGHYEPVREPKDSQNSAQQPVLRASISSRGLRVRVFKG